mmetsp:Transcript_12677/g.17047  ORF Transcript_12677/g.17047 Transcript_12677/m.17047 type:complete len:236 (+) Transcript_12677:143-850(+)
MSKVAINIPANLPSADDVRGAKKIVHFPDIIADPDLKQLFIDFLEAEMMHENFLFWLDVEEYKTIKDRRQSKAFFEHIFKKYLGPNAEMEMCIAGRRRAFIEKNRDAPPPNVFDYVQQDVYVAMSQECVPRFCKSEIYLSWLVNKPDSPRTRFSRQKLQEFFGMEINGLLYRAELVQVVSNPGYEKSVRKRKRTKKTKVYAQAGDKFYDPSKTHGSMVAPTFSGSSAVKKRGERK